MNKFLSLIRCASQSKLSQDQLVELQKSTHFDKKELQQWYKGVSHRMCFSRPLSIMPLYRTSSLRPSCQC